MPTPSFLQKRARRRTRARMYRAGLLLALPPALGCGDQSLRPEPPPSQADLYWALELNHHGVVMDTAAPYNTLQLVATPRNFRGEALTGLPAAQYVSRDPERLIVSPDGELIALAPTTTPVTVLATLTVNNLKHTDSVLVSVVDDPSPSPLASFSIHPVPPDSAKQGVAPGGQAEAFAPWDTLPIRAMTAGGELLPVYTRDPDGFLPVHFGSSDTVTAQFVSFGGTVGVLKGLRRGSVNIYASTTVFGSPEADTLEYRFGWPVAMAGWVSVIGNGRVVLQQPDITIGTGGFVAWFMDNLDKLDAPPVDITFADGDLPNVAALAPVLDHVATFSPFLASFCSVLDCTTAGSFVLSPADTPPVGQFRHFPVPGTYEYHSSSTGISGRVVVVDER